MSDTPSPIRPGTEADLEAIAGIHNSLYPEFPETAKELAHQDEQRRLDMQDPKQPIKWQRWVWEEGGQVLAQGSYGQDPWMYHPRKFNVWTAVHPDHHRRGIGARLFEHINDAVMAHDPIKLSSWTCPEKTPQSVAFLESRGFKAGMKVWDSKLTLSDWDPESFAGAVEHAEGQGLKLVDMKEFAKRYPDWERKLYEMERQIWGDVPLPDKQTDPGFDWFRRHVLESPNFYPEAAWVALDGDLPVGLSALWKQLSGDQLVTGLTGTTREHRRRGIAMALKVKSLAFAKGKGHPWVTTDNEENNVGMIAINRALGFQDYPSWMGFEKLLDEEF